MKAVYDSFGSIVGVETMESGDQMEVTDSDGDSIAIDVSEALELETFDLTTTSELSITTTDDTIADGNVGKGAVLGHPIQLEVNTYDLTATDEIQISSTDDTIAEGDAGKGALLGHPVHLDVKAVGSDVAISVDEDVNWDGGEW